MKNDDTRKEETMQLHENDYVIFIEENGTRQHAIVTTIWPQMGGDTLPPGCNLAYLKDGDKEPKRHSSVPHISHVTGASGFFWTWPHEDEWAIQSGPFGPLWKELATPSRQIAPSSKRGRSKMKDTETPHFTSPCPELRAPYPDDTTIESISQADDREATKNDAELIALLNAELAVTKTERDAIQEALRHISIVTIDFGITWDCRSCKGTWVKNEKENHAATCRALPTHKYEGLDSMGGRRLCFVT